MTDKVTEIRAQIDAIDDEINVLLARRAACGIAMKAAKGGKNIYRPAREQQIIKRVLAGHRGVLPQAVVRAIFTEIIASVRNLEESLTVACLGPAGSYSHEAARRYFGSTSQIMPVESLAEVVRAVEAGNAKAGLLPIENSTEGSVAETHKLLAATNLKIIGETTLTVRHCLLSKATQLKNVKRVYSHPQALGQCRQWLQRHLPHADLVSQPSTSRGVELAAQDPTAAAIAGEQAAELSGMPLLARGINDEPDNQTRFIALAHMAVEPTGDDKTSILCTVRDKPGALHELLGVLAERGITLTRLESQPSGNDSYMFYIDFLGHQADSTVADALKALQLLTKTCKILGSYPKGITL